MHVTDRAETQKEDPLLSTLLNWLKAQKKTHLKALLAEHASSKDGQLILWSWQNFTYHQGALYLCLMPKCDTEDLQLFVVPKAHCVTAFNGCHRDAGHQVTTVPCPCCRTISGGQAWSITCSNPLSPACIACNMRAICSKNLYTRLCPLL